MTRPRHAHSFTISLELITAGDFPRPVLARLLTQLATAGLHNMVSAVRSVELDGAPAAAELCEPDPRVKMLHPPTDERIIKAIHQLETGLQALRSMVDYPSEAVA